MSAGKHYLLAPLVDDQDCSWSQKESAFIRVIISLMTSTDGSGRQRL
jgi:hypothetical protein